MTNAYAFERVANELPTIVLHSLFDFTVVTYSCQELFEFLYRIRLVLEEH